MDITKSREEFEKWANRLPSISITGRLERCGENYVDDYHTVFWLAWKAARESIEVERISPTDVPPDVVYQLGGAGLSHSMAICEAYSTGFNVALRTAGIRIKGESEKC